MLELGKALNVKPEEWSRSAESPPEYEPTDKYAYVTSSGRKLLTKEYYTFEQWECGAAVEMPILDDRTDDVNGAENVLPFEVD